MYIRFSLYNSQNVDCGVLVENLPHNNNISVSDEKVNPYMVNNFLKFSFENGQKAHKNPIKVSIVSDYRHILTKNGLFVLVFSVHGSSFARFFLGYATGFGFINDIYVIYNSLGATI